MDKTYVKDYTNTYEIHGHKYQVTAPARFDMASGQIVEDAELDDAAAKIARAMYRSEFGIVAPESIKEYRAQIGLSQREFAKLLGWSPNTVAMYEVGGFPSESNNKLLKMLIADNHVLYELAQQTAGNDKEALIAKVNAYLNGQDGSKIVVFEEPRFTAMQLANWFRADNYFQVESDINAEYLTQMKVVKLLYFAYGRYLARTGNKLFSSPIIAMPYGPVVAEIHDSFDGQREIVFEGMDAQVFDDFSAIQRDHEISDLLMEILNDFGDYTASGLSRITHRAGSPWSRTESYGVINPTVIETTFVKGIEQ